MLADNFPGVREKMTCHDVTCFKSTTQTNKQIKENAVR